MTPQIPKRTSAPIDSIFANPRNDRLHPRAQIDLLKNSIRKFGQPRPILVRTENRMIVAGHGVHQAMLELGEKTIDVLLWDVNQDVADQFLVADNRFGDLSVSDDARLRELLAGFDDLPALGFLPEDIDALLGAGESIPIVEVDATTVRDEFWITIRGALANQAAALDRLRLAMSDLGNVSVDLGTIAQG